MYKLSILPLQFFFFFFFHFSYQLIQNTSHLNLYFITSFNKISLKKISRLPNTCKITGNHIPRPTAPTYIHSYRPYAGEHTPHWQPQPTPKTTSQDANQCHSLKTRSSSPRLSQTLALFVSLCASVENEGSTGNYADQQRRRRIIGVDRSSEVVDLTVSHLRIVAPSHFITLTFPHPPNIKSNIELNH